MRHENAEASDMPFAAPPLMPANPPPSPPAAPMPTGVFCQHCHVIHRPSRRVNTDALLTLRGYFGLVYMDGILPLTSADAKFTYDFVSTAEWLRRN